MMAYMLLWTSLWGSSKLVPAEPVEAMVLKSLTEDMTRYCNEVRDGLGVSSDWQRVAYHLVLQGARIGAQLLVHDVELVKALIVGLTGGLGPAPAVVVGAGGEIVVGVVERELLPLVAIQGVLDGGRPLRSVDGHGRRGSRRRKLGVGGPVPVRHPPLLRGRLISRGVAPGILRRDLGHVGPKNLLLYLSVVA